MSPADWLACEGQVDKLRRIAKEVTRVSWEVGVDGCVSPGRRTHGITFSYIR